MTSRNVPRLRFKGFGDEWKREKLGNVSDVTKLAGFEFSKYVTYKNSGNIIALRGLNIKNDSLDLSDVKYIDGSNFDKLSRSKLFSGDILYTYVGTVGNSAIIDEDDKYYLAPNVALIRINNSNVYNRFIQKEISTSRFFKKIVYPLAASSSQIALSMNAIRQFCISFPEVSEQQHIGNFFSKLDHLIDLHSQKLEQLKKLKRGYLQKMFPQKGETVPRLRFNGFINDWHNVKVDKLLEHNNIRNKDLSITNVESVSNKKGFIKQTDQFEDYSVASKDLSNYIVIKPGMFAYNPSRINVGSIAFKDLESKESIVSPLYVSFKTKNNLNDDFLWYWFKTDWFRYQREKYSEGGVRDTLSFKTLAGMDFLLPSLEEQKKISVFLNKIDNLIEQQNEKINSVNDIKKYYLQRMFI